MSSWSISHDPDGHHAITAGFSFDDSVLKPSKVYYIQHEDDKGFTRSYPFGISKKGYPHLMDLAKMPDVCKGIVIAACAGARAYQEYTVATETVHSKVDTKDSEVRVVTRVCCRECGSFIEEKNVVIKPAEVDKFLEDRHNEYCQVEKLQTKEGGFVTYTLFDETKLCKICG